MLNWTQKGVSEPGQTSLLADTKHNHAQQALTRLPIALLPIAWLAILRPATKATQPSHAAPRRGFSKAHPHLCGTRPGGVSNN